MTEKCVKCGAEVEHTRHKLPETRRGQVHKFDIAGTEGYLITGEYPDGTLGEIFIVIAKEGATLSGVLDTFATAVSLALQYGTPLLTFVDKFTFTSFEPSGYTGDPEIPRATSITDYLFRWLALKYLPRDQLPFVHDDPEPEPVPIMQPAHGVVS